MLKEISTQLKKLSNKEKARILQRFFKTGKGEYAEGDIFLGITVPQIRKVAKEFASLSLTDTVYLLKSPFHEERLLALLILVNRFSKSNASRKEMIFKLYLRNTKCINNWDLIDLTAGHIVGAYLFDRNKELLYRLAKSKSLWERRIAIIATFYFIKNFQFDDTLAIAEALLSDKHDLIHKAVGWMLREVGKKDMRREEEFLKGCYKKMPRTMLRYAIERFPETKRQAYLKGTI